MNKPITFIIAVAMLNNIFSLGAIAFCIGIRSKWYWIVVWILFFILNLFDLARRLL